MKSTTLSFGGGGAVQTRGFPVYFTDLAFLLLVVYITQTQWIETAHGTVDGARESTLPPADLSQLQEEVQPTSGLGDDLVVVSVTTDPNGVAYVLGEDQLSLTGVASRMREQAAGEVCIRAEGDVAHEHVMRLMAHLEGAGVASVSLAYESVQEVD